MPTDNPGWEGSSYASLGSLMVLTKAKSFRHVTFSGLAGLSLELILLNFEHFAALS